MSNQVCAGTAAGNCEFWGRAAAYARAGRDEPFVSELAYVMVTLYRSSA